MAKTLVTHTGNIILRLDVIAQHTNESRKVFKEEIKTGKVLLFRSIATSFFPLPLFYTTVIQVTLFNS